MSCLEKNSLPFILTTTFGQDNDIEIIHFSPNIYIFHLQFMFVYDTWGHWIICFQKLKVPEPLFLGTVGYIILTRLSTESN